MEKFSVAEFWDRKGNGGGISIGPKFQNGSIV